MKELEEEVERAVLAAESARSRLAQALKRARELGRSWEARARELEARCARLEELLREGGVDRELARVREEAAAALAAAEAVRREGVEALEEARARRGDPPTRRA